LILIGLFLVFKYFRKWITYLIFSKKKTTKK
jgi:hypothetical protein